MGGSQNVYHANGRGGGAVRRRFPTARASGQPRACQPFLTLGWTVAWSLLCSVALYGHAAERPDFEGTYVDQLTHFDDPRWRFEDLLCRSCTVEAFEYTQALLADPANDDRSLDEIHAEVEAMNREHHARLLTSVAQEQSAQFDQADDPVHRCEPVGLVYQIGQPLPWQIEQHDDRVVFRYEFWNTVRTVFMDGRGHPADLAPSRLGHSIGWYDGETLVVETRGIASRLYSILFVDGLVNTTGAIIIERYTRALEGNRLDLERTVIDPVMLRRPLTTRHSYLSAPDIELIEDVCEAVSGEY